MKKLIILRGAMGCGKSTFIKEKGLEMYTLSTDTLRLLFNSKEMTTEYTEMIPQFNNKKVWELLFSILEERMKKGELTIIDAVHPCKEDFTPYKKLAENIVIVFMLLILPRFLSKKYIKEMKTENRTK